MKRNSLEDDTLKTKLKERFTQRYSLPRCKRIFKCIEESTALYRMYKASKEEIWDKFLQNFLLGVSFTFTSPPKIIK